MTYFKVLAQITIADHSEARLLEEILQRELRDRAGTIDEKTLANWHNDIVKTRREAVAQNWTGWEGN